MAVAVPNNMILILAIVAGLLAGIVWAYGQRMHYEVPVLQHLWLVFVAFLPQYIAIQLRFPTWQTALCLSLSQLLLFAFALRNRNHWGMKILMIGSLLNFVVMALNNGFMPISRQTAGRLVPQNIVADLPSGSRFGHKDILLAPQETHLEWLADRFLPPAWLPYQVAFSLGDIFIAAGVFWLLARQKNIEQGYNP